MTLATTSALLDAIRHDPAAFRKVLVIPSAHGPARLADVIAPFQRDDFAALDTGFIAVSRGEKPPTPRFFLERTKGASKDSDIAVEILWLIAFSARQLVIQIGAADSDQADELRKAAKQILSLNGWLAQLVKLQATAIINERTGSRADVLTAEASSAHGSRPDVLIVNELSHISDREFAETLMDNAAKIPNGLVVIATNAGFIPSWQFDWRENARTSERWHFSAFSQPAPWLDPAEIAEAKRRNSPQRFARLFEGVWASGGGGDALHEQDLLASVRLAGALDAPEPGWCYYAGLDLSWKQDNSALAVVGLQAGGVVMSAEPDEEPQYGSTALRAAHELGLIAGPRRSADKTPEFTVLPTSQRVKLVYLRAWRPPGGGRTLDLSQIENTILQVHHRFNLQAVCFDPAQAVLLAQRLARRGGVPMIEVPQVSGNLQTMATLMLDHFTSGTIDLFNDADLLAELRALRLHERADGGFRLVSPRSAATGHGDRCTSLQLGLLAIKKNPPRIVRMLNDGAPIFLFPEASDYADDDEDAGPNLWD